MSTFWTPGGEKPIPQAEPEPAPPPTSDEQLQRSADTADPTEAEARELAELMAIQAQILATPCAMVVADHCMSLYELAALYLSPDPPQLGDARVAIDSLDALIEVLGSKLGEHEAALKQGLSQLRMGWVEAQDRLVKSGGEQAEG
ncbi:MAG: hypothetical protein QOD63_3110 [Actinomycetota bacterium]|nr:hypothetical protein [Actinomycetota bacterium]